MMRILPTSIVAVAAADSWSGMSVPTWTGATAFEDTHASDGPPAIHNITNLPGLGDVTDMHMTSGYLPVDGGKKYIFYWYIPVDASTGKSPDEVPLVLWFTGGPGCSGLSALLTENGPFVPRRAADGSQYLERVDYSWTLLANVLWIEQPAGVGYSYTKGSKTSESSDTQSGRDNYDFMTGFVDLYGMPNDFWITGESYAGMYGPTLSLNILEGAHDLKNHFKGFMLGNPVLFCESAGLNRDAFKAFQFQRYFYNGLLPFDLWLEWNQHECDATLYGASSGRSLSKEKCLGLFGRGEQYVGEISQQLKKEETLMLSASKDKGVQADLDPDNLYHDFCYGNASLAPPMNTNPADCHPEGATVGDWLSSSSVRSALGVVDDSAREWSVCQNGALLSYNSDKADEGLIPTLRQIFKLNPDLHVLYYSGDVDIATVPTQATQACLAELQSGSNNRGNSVTEWKPWTVNGWHVGYVERFDRYTFATVKAGGHEVPTYQPQAAFNMFDRFMNGNLDLDDKHQWASGALRSTAPVEQPITQGAVLKALVRSQTDGGVELATAPLLCDQRWTNWAQNRAEYATMLVACADPACEQSKCGDERVCSELGNIWKSLKDEWSLLGSSCSDDRGVTLTESSENVALFSKNGDVVGAGIAFGETVSGEFTAKFLEEATSGLSYVGGPEAFTTEKEDVVTDIPVDVPTYLTPPTW